MYNLPHELDRPYQVEALEWILTNKKKYLILCAPTGFGKSPLPAATSIDYKTLVLVLHKSLQSANYKDQYGFDILYGKSNYPCLESEGKAVQLNMIDMPKLTAFDCSNPECNCPYQQQELVCLGSNRVSLNYAKFLMSRPFVDMLSPDYLFLDEAHNLPDIVTDFVGFTINWANEFLEGIEPKKPGLLTADEALGYFRRIASIIEDNKPKRELASDLTLHRKWKRLSQKTRIFNDLVSNSDLGNWYFESTNKGLILKPLSAEYHFKQFFGCSDKVVLMSATITPRIASRLGLNEDEFDFMEVPSNWPVPTRLIYDLETPAINYRSSDEDKQHQALSILKQLQRDKTGIIHVTSKKQAGELQTLLYELEGNNGTFDFVVLDNGLSTDEQYKKWCNARNAGIYCISWCFHEGIDLGEDDINIVAKVPYPGLGSGYEEARRDHDAQWYLEKTAYKFMQALGRHQRGKLEHYAPGARLSFIADSAYHRIKDYLSSDFKKRIRKLI